MTMTELIVAGLAVWRISSLLISEIGPLRVFYRIRTAVGIEHDDELQPVAYPANFLAYLLSCVWCLSVWLGLFYYLAYLYWHDYVLWVSVPFALSALVILIDSAIEDGPLVVVDMRTVTKNSVQLRFRRALEMSIRLKLAERITRLAAFIGGYDAVIEDADTE